MRLEVKYPDKPAQEVELKVTMVVLGRDPSCDLVINDERCSRRHAVIEMTPTGLQVRDSGSANGIFVNGKKLERAPLAAFDLVRLGEVIIKVLPEEGPGTLVMATDELVELGPAPAAPAKAAGPTSLDTGAVARRAAPRPPARTPTGDLPSRPASGEVTVRPHLQPASASPSPRPLTVTVLAGLWLVSVVFYAAAALGAAPLLGLNGMAAAAAIASSALLAFVSAVMAYGLFTLRPWARLLQAIIAGLGLVICPFTLASATTLIYALRPGTRAAFAGAPPGSAAAGAAESAELTFALTLIGTVILGAALCLTGGLFARFAQ